MIKYNNVAKTRPHAQLRNQERALCITGGEDPDSRFLSHHKEKTEGEKEIGILQPLIHQEKGQTRALYHFTYFIS